MCAISRQLDSLHRLCLPPFGCLLCSASVSLTCTIPQVRRPQLCRNRYRLNSHGMQSASLYNYASITCSVHALISHFKSMTRTYQASLRSDPGSLLMQVFPTGLFITGFKGSMRPPTLRCLWETTWLRGGTHWHTAGMHKHSTPAKTAPSVDWPRLHSVIPDGSQIAMLGLIAFGSAATDMVQTQLIY